ncbi:MAG TPA: DUF3443 family protein, partial [Saprospiraceae bacterium]|nr:DUF3443 family protein [Saprospiraceae bacterium]
MPIGLGEAAIGGEIAALQIGIGLFSEPVDIYFGIYAPPINADHIYVLTPENNLHPVSINSLLSNGTLKLSSGTLTPWMTNTLGGINEPVLRQMPVSSLPPGTYSLFLLVTPAGNLNSYYLWSTTARVGDNVIPISVNGPLCASGSYANKPCVSVKVCTPGTATCQVIDDILLDTGSVGLRVFKQALYIALDQVSLNTGLLAECIQFGDGSSDWGPVKIADVILGSEPAVEVPIHVIDAGFGTPSPACSGAHQTPNEAGFNGILGVGLFSEDCGSLCENLRSNGMYYACSGLSCTASSVSLPDQVKNPVAFLPSDNNGVMIELQDVVLDGFPSAGGYLVLGVGTQSNNIPSGVATYATNQSGDLFTTFNGSDYSSFIDTGSNGLFFPAGMLSSLLKPCTGPYTGWYCPSSVINLSATNMGAFGSASGIESFQVGNFAELINSSNFVFSDIG